MCPPFVPEHHERMRSMVDDHLRFVARTLRKAGVPPSDIDDEVQRTFIVVADRLDRVLPGAERSFLFQVAHNVAAHARRALARRRDVPSGIVPERVESLATPENLASRKQTRKVLDGIVGAMSEPLRTVFLLYEVEEMNLAEIARLLHVPRGTVASRLRRARAQVRKNVEAIELACELDVDGAEQIEGPELLRCENVGRLGRALLRVGTAPFASAALRGRTLAACLDRARA